MRKTQGRHPTTRPAHCTPDARPTGLSSTACVAEVVSACSGPRNAGAGASFCWHVESREQAIRVR